MKKFVLILLLAIGLAAGGLLANATQAQTAFTPIYWITGAVTAQLGVTIEGRRVVFYQDPIDNGYSDNIVGISGLAGRPNDYALNAFEDHRLNITAGQNYRVATVRGADNMGAGPVNVTLSGIGYDIVNLALVQGGGIILPGIGVGEDSGGDNNNGGGGGGGSLGTPPIIQGITFGNRLYQPALVERGQDFIVSSQPRVTGRIVSPYGVRLNTLTMAVGEGASASTYSFKAANIVSAAGSAEAPTDVNFVYDFSQERQTLPDGRVNVTFRASNAHGDASQACLVMVAGGEPRLIGVPIIFPSPVHLKTDNSVTFQYTLSRDMDIDFSIFDVSGQIIRKVAYSRGAEGGAAGVNKVTWNLMTDQGQKMASGICIFTLISRENGKLLGKGKFTALP